MAIYIYESLILIASDYIAEFIQDPNLALQNSYPVSSSLFLSFHKLYYFSYAKFKAVTLFWEYISGAL